MNIISRYDFLRQLGFGGTALLTALCFGTESCKDESSDTTSVAKDFTINLDQANFSALKTTGGSVVEQDVVIACTGPGVYKAVTVICSHEGKKKVGYQPSVNNFKCTEHGAVFDVNGNHASGPGSKGIRVYQTELKGSMLRIYSS